MGTNISDSDSNENNVSSESQHSDSDSTIDLFPNMTNFRKKFTSNFVFAYNYVNSYRHKHAPICDILCILPRLIHFNQSDCLLPVVWSEHSQRGQQLTTLTSRAIF